MKVFIAVILFVVMLGSNIEVDAGSFNASGFWDPGFSFGRRHRLQHKYQARNNEDGDENPELPQPDPTHHIEWPEIVNDLNETDSDDNERPQPPQSRPHHRSHKH